ncbi:PTS fructose transporter subunit IIC [Streptococcus intermedius]|uniref:PTS mannose/fructose/sorbose/N-acetylgalactosamine transporter subunit IIC n=1 Tax=Streptococcus intermedius TaxID=1338 RepID=UPI00029BF6C5|nr:PTS mannose/fructose/sorbose/N-acetylgalactosamine transporter subunit IIC [Streptococcus intermedius]ALF26998.1 PTS fructose transporter subunit IIC [Streptococcus intermedius]ARC26637.1 PTS mannose/fructose/sorbose/N-acetylgalactosamine transporter subunit IIC [Streptococcus intermedius]EKU18063.1 PTS system sorbose-specific iic component family protein [Streptococcus intermedius BA1]
MIQWWQILLLTLYSAYQILDELTINSSAGSPVFAGFITGLVMGDLKTGLFIGGSLQLVVLGVGTFGGASRIDATSGAVLATAFSVATGIKAELAISAIAVPVAALLVYTDVLGRFSTTYFAHRIDAAVEKFDYKGVERNYLLGAIPWGLSRALPVFLALWLGGDAVKVFSDWLANNAQWIADGLILAGKMLPGVGFAILLRYLPVKKNLHYLGLGFAITAMLKVVFDYISTLATASSAVKPIAKALGGAKFEGLPMIGIAIIGFALAALSYQNAINKQVATVAAEQSESGEIDDDEL